VIPAGSRQILDSYNPQHGKSGFLPAMQSIVRSDKLFFRRKSYCVGCGWNHQLIVEGSGHLSGFVPTTSVIAVHCLLRLNAEMHYRDSSRRVPCLHQCITKLFVNLGVLTQVVRCSSVPTLMPKLR